MRVLCALGAAALALASEQVVLRNGFSIRVERHERSGETVRLHTATGVIEIPASQMAWVEEEEYRPPPAVAAEPEKPAAAGPAAQPRDARQLVEQAAERHGLPPALLHSVARAESAYQRDAVSPKGAIGVMQLMPGTAAMLNADPRDPEQNIDAGARHLRDLLIQYNGATRKALAAYNAGAGAVSKYGGVPPYRETQTYVEKVLRDYWKLAEKAERR